MMCWWCPDDALKMNKWCSDDALLMRWWCIDDAQMMHWWCASVIFDILKSSSFQKYNICHVFCARTSYSGDVTDAGQMTTNKGRYGYSWMLDGSQLESCAVVWKMSPWMSIWSASFCCRFQGKLHCGEQRVHTLLVVIWATPNNDALCCLGWATDHRSLLVLWHGQKTTHAQIFVLECLQV